MAPQTWTSWPKTEKITAFSSGLNSGYSQSEGWKPMLIFRIDSLCFQTFIRWQSSSESKRRCTQYLILAKQIDGPVSSLFCGCKLEHHTEQKRRRRWWGWQYNYWQNPERTCLQKFLTNEKYKFRLTKRYTSQPYFRSQGSLSSGPKPFNVHTELDLTRE